MSRPVIAFDLDDVLADSTEFWRVEVNKRTGLSLAKEHYRVPGEYWGYYENVWLTHKVDHLISIPDVDAQIVEDQSEIRAYADALATLEVLAKQYKLVVVTARGGDQESETKNWLEHNFPDMFEELIFANGHTGLASKNKGDICREVGATWLVDDNPSHCQDAIDKGVEAVLFGEYGWHQNVPSEATLCRDWQAVKRFFDERAR